MAQRYVVRFKPVTREELAIGIELAQDEEPLGMFTDGEDHYLAYSATIFDSHSLTPDDVPRETGRPGG